MELSSQAHDNITIIQVEGRIDHKSAKDFELAFAPFLESDQGDLLLDLSGLEFMTSSGLRVLMIAAKTCQKQGREIVVAALQPKIKEIFQISRFDLILKVHESVEVALNNL